MSTQFTEMQATQPTQTTQTTQPTQTKPELIMVAMVNVFWSVNFVMQAFFLVSLMLKKVSCSMVVKM